MFKRFFVFIFILAAGIMAQHRGDNLSFQGLINYSDVSVKSSAMGGAFTAYSGDIDALFHNPAGLSGIKSLQISVAANSAKNTWFENQHYRPDRYFLTLPFYLERLYIPDPANNGELDHLRLWTDDQLLDSSYVVSAPALGLDPFSEEAADWKTTANVSGLSHIAIAFPFSVADYNFVAAASYNIKNNVEDYDRNQTYLDPHIGYFGYGNIGRVNGQDTIVMGWYDYIRTRSGKLNEINAALSFKYSEELKFGLGVELVSGSTDDFHSLNKIGHFDLIKSNTFRFSYDTLYQKISGTSDYSSTAFNVGFMLELEKLSIGLNIDLPYTFKREYSYKTHFQDTASTISGALSGTDEISFPAVFNLGVSFRPVESLNLALDYEFAPLSKAEFTTASADSTLRNWADRQTISFGFDYQPFDFLSIQGGYRVIPQEFVPDGAALADVGPKAKSINFGVGIHTFIGTLQLAYQLRTLRYYDSYYSNTNYNTIQYSNIMAGFKYTL